MPSPPQPSRPSLRLRRDPVVRVAVASAALARSARWGAALVTLVAALAGCARSPASNGPMPPASFLVSAGDSTFWVETVDGEARVRRSPMLLTEHAGRFYELYLTDDDRSYYDAVILGQRIYRRDLATGDSLVLFEDSSLATLASEYAARHPGDSPLPPDEDAAEEPSIQATTDTELLDAAGPFLTIEQHVDIDVVGDRDQHLTRRSVIDVRDGHLVSVGELVGEDEARQLYARAQRLFNATLDSIRRAKDDRARRALNALTGFVFDSMSFALIDEDGAPAVAFLVPGRGARAGGYALPLPPLRITAGPWWAQIRAGLPRLSGSDAEWRGNGYDVVAREDSSGEAGLLVLRAGPNEWTVARLPLPIRRLLRLELPAASPETLDALRRAFDESALYSGEVRTAAAPPPRRTSPGQPAGNWHVTEVRTSRGNSSLIPWGSP